MLRKLTVVVWLAGSCLLASLFASGLASGQRGQVTFGGLPVPGATITATQGAKQAIAISDAQGQYSFPDLADGVWSIRVEMTGFSPVSGEITVTPNAPAAKWELKMKPLAQIAAAPVASAPAETSASQAPVAKPEQASPAAPTETKTQAAMDDGFLINGSVNNGLASPFAQLAAFGNHRTSGRRGLYNGGIGFTFDNSALDARPYSLTGQNTPKAGYNRLTTMAALGGPLKIPHLLDQHAPNFFVAYQWTRNNDATTQPALMPDAAERSGILREAVRDPATGEPFAGNIIPQSRISPQAQALLRLYPLPNINGNAQYNYQVPLVSPAHQDALQSRISETLNRNNEVYGRFAFQDTRMDSPNVFGFLDTTDILGMNAGVNWSHRFSRGLFFNLGDQFSRLATRVRPYFANHENVSGNAGISGNNQDPANWGPPALNFSSGIAGLTEQQSAFNRTQTNGVSYSMLWNRGQHNFMFGGDFRRQEFNYLSQQDARGTFTFTGAASGSAVGDFLLGVPDTSSIAFGNADKYFRESVYDAYFTDDWRVTPGLTLNLGVRWEYGAPITELYGRLVNLDIAPGFAAVAPVLANDPVGTLTGANYPSSLLRPDKRGFEPRIGLAWRPLPASSMVIRAGYGIYYDTSVYQTLAVQMAQQPPLSTTLSVQNSVANPLTLANGFTASPGMTTNTFAIDPNLRVGYAQIWQASLQRDLPGSLQMTASYLGVKGTRGVQEFLPNTYPTGAVNPCPACPTGFAYFTSNGNSTRESGQIQLRRRLHNGLTASLLYTFSKSIDNDASLGGQGASANSQNGSSQNGNDQNSSSGGPPGSSGVTPGPPNLLIAQNWRDLQAERSLSAFDQRHLLSLQLQYTTGMGTGGGTLLSGWKGTLLKEWTFATQITAGSGLPETPIYLAPVPGTGVTGTIRPDYTGATLYRAPVGLALNPAAYAAPQAGTWGNAGRNTITGPAQFSLSASLGRTFRLSDRLNLDWRVDSTNALNHVTFTNWNTTVNNAQFGLPAAANAMRSMQMTVRVRF